MFPLAHSSSSSSSVFHCLLQRRRSAFKFQIFDPSSSSSILCPPSLRALAPSERNLCSSQNQNVPQPRRGGIFLPIEPRSGFTVPTHTAISQRQRRCIIQPSVAVRKDRLRWVWDHNLNSTPTVLNQIATAALQPPLAKECQLHPLFDCHTRWLAYALTSLQLPNEAVNAI
jgi:hypothetical protein